MRSDGAMGMTLSGETPRAAEQMCRLRPAGITGSARHQALARLTSTYAFISGESEELGAQIDDIDSGHSSRSSAVATAMDERKGSLCLGAALGLRVGGWSQSLSLQHLNQC